MSKYYKVIESYNDQKVGDIIELSSEEATSLIADGRIEAIVEEDLKETEQPKPESNPEQ